MPILTLTDAHLAFGHLPLLDGAAFQLDPKERVGLIGRNGAGKSSLLAVLAGDQTLDSGERWVNATTRLALVPQEPQLDPHNTVYEAVALGLGTAARSLTAYHDALAALEHAPDDPRCQAELARAQAELDHHGWTLGHRVDAVISHLELAPDVRVGTLSGGGRKRVALAQALAATPDVLLLDEPTNHLDITSITWLEALARDFPGAIVCITHDRRFLDAIATRIVELDRGVLKSYPGQFSEYQERKQAELAAEALAQARFDKLLAQEEVWIRKGVEARRTRNEGRVRRLEALRGERAARRERLGQVNLRIDEGERSGRLVAELRAVSKAFGGRVLIGDFSTRILRGDRIGLVGPNGCGKSTLLKLILGEIAPDSGTVRRGTGLAVAYFDQFREALDPDATLAETISPGADYVTVGTGRRHVVTYLGDFLFPPERARSPVRSLSGGERNRLLLARLFAQPANVLVLDEPTNDLDIETLELLEALLQDFDGTLFLVSHDRAFLDNVVTQTIAFEGNGLLREHAGGYSDWETYRQRELAAAADAADKRPAPRAAAPPRERPAAAPGGLTLQERRELESLPGTIDTLEARIVTLRERFADPALYRGAGDERIALERALAEAEQVLADTLVRWEALEARQSGPR